MIETLEYKMEKKFLSDCDVVTKMLNLHQVVLLAAVSMVVFVVTGCESTKKLENGLLLGYILAQKAPRFLPL